MFNSQKINNDPMPWLDVFGHGRKRKQRYVNDEFAPRSEFDNNPNPILESFRSAGGVDPSGLLLWLDHVGQNRSDAGYLWVKDVHIEHARKVLTRLAALAA